MASRTGNPAPHNPQGDSREIIPGCSICNGTMILAYDRYQQKVCVCTDCHTSITIPGEAWQVARVKRESKTFNGTERRRVGRRAGDA